MKAVYCKAFGPPEVMELRDVAIPEPKPGEVRVRVVASGAIAGDCELRRGEVKPMFWLPLRLMFGVVRPRVILGQEMSGIVDAVGSSVTRFKRGDAVFGISGIKLSTYAEYICLSETALTPKPPGLSYEQAAVIGVGGMNALCFLRHAGAIGDDAAGRHILVNGAGGNIGTMAVQLARFSGVTVDAIDSADKLDLLRDLGASRVFDYRRDDAFTEDSSYDAIIDIHGNLTFPPVQHALKPGGVMVLGNPPGIGLLRGVRTGHDGKSVVPAMAGEAQEDFEYLMRLAVEGAISPVVDRAFPIESVIEAHRYIETGAKKGCVVLNVTDA